MPRKKYSCSNCKGTNVEIKVWINPNFEKSPTIPNDLEEDADSWCEDCEEHYSLIITE